MAIKFNTVKCPECGANLSIEEGRDRMFCSYCGAQVIATNENEHIIRTIDEAEIKKSEADLKMAEADLMLKMKQLEMFEKRQKTKQSINFFWSCVLGIGIVIGMLMCGYVLVFTSQDFGTQDFGIGITGMLVVEICGFALMSKNNSNNKEGQEEFFFGDYIRFPNSLVTPNPNQNYLDAERVLRQAGFTNVDCVPLNDVVFGLFAQPDKISQIKVNGCLPTKGKSYPASIPIEITYHSYSGR